MPHIRAEAGWLRNITAGGTSTLVSCHPKEKQPLSLRSCEGLQWNFTPCSAHAASELLMLCAVHTASVGDFCSCAEKTCFQEAL